MKNPIQNLVFILALLQSYNFTYYCSNSNTILQAIKGVEKEYIGEGSFGVIKGNSTEVSKTMKTNESTSLLLLNNELKVMIAFNDEVDFMQLHPDNCWYKKKTGRYDYSIKIKMDRMSTDLKNAMKECGLKSRTIWKIDILFKIAIALKKMHDAGLMHLDLKEQNIMMMNRYTPVIADFGMALLPGQSRTFVGGTPLFMSPEVNRGIYSYSADIYALGIIYFQILNEKFVNNQNFRKTCRSNERTYSSVYCSFDSLIDSMLSYSSTSRPSINKVITEILSVMKRYIELNKDSYDDYMNTEYQYYNSKSSTSKVTQKYSNLLKKKFNERKAIYDLAGKGSSSSTLVKEVNEYAAPQKSAKQFFKDNSKTYSIVGYDMQNIKEQKIEEILADNLKSKINIQHRMNKANQSRKNFLKNEEFFNDDEIKDQEFGLPDINVKKKKIPSNDIRIAQNNRAFDNHLPALDKKYQFKSPDLDMAFKAHKSPSDDFKFHNKLPSDNFNVRGRVPSNKFKAQAHRSPSNNFKAQAHRSPSNNFKHKVAPLRRKQPSNQNVLPKISPFVDNHRFNEFDRLNDFEMNFHRNELDRLNRQNLALGGIDLDNRFQNFHNFGNRLFI